MSNFTCLFECLHADYNECECTNTISTRCALTNQIGMILVLHFWFRNTDFIFRSGKR